MKNNTLRGLTAKYFFPAVVLILLGIFFVFCRGRFRTDLPEISYEDGYADVRDCDFENEVYCLNNWDYFPGVLYTPEDFAEEGKAPQPGIFVHGTRHFVSVSLQNRGLRI